MHVRNWRDIVADVADASVDPDRWRAVGGRRTSGLGEVLFLGHPDAGVYHLRTYARNPYKVRGVGARVARTLDDELDPLLPDADAPGRFAVQSRPETEREAAAVANRVEETVREHAARADEDPDDLFSDLMGAVDSPAFGPAAYDLAGRPEPLADLSDQFEASESVLDAELDDLIDEDGVDRGFQ